MKKIITATTIVFCSLLSLGQTKEFYDNVIEKAPFIFEGQVIERVFFVDTNNFNKPYTSNKVLITNILRKGGALKLGTVNIITEGGAQESNGIVFMDEDQFTQKFCVGSNCTYIFFGFSVNSKVIGTVYPSSGRIIQVANEEVGYTTSTDFLVPADNSIILKSPAVINSHYLKGMGMSFKNRQDIYDFLGKQKNITIPKELKEIKPIEKKEMEEQPPVKKKDVPGSGKVTKQIDYAKQVERYNLYMDHLQVRIDAAQKNKANIPVTPFDTTVCKELFISEMIEGTAKNKALEIFNPKNVPVDLANFAIRIFHNGQLTPIKVPLSGTIAPKSTHVIAHPAANNDIKARAHEFDTKINFDGNDAIVLEKGNGGNYIDKIGEIGVNPGNGGWTCTSGSTKDQTLRRKGNIGEGEMDWQSCRQQWTDHPKDNSANLKQHQGVCAAATNDVTFSFANAIETGVFPNKFLEFDIMIEADDDSTYLDNCSFFIQYNPGAFGTNVIANGKVTITKGTNFNSVTYVDPNTVVQDDSTVIYVFNFGIDYGQTSWDRTNVTTFPQQLVHIKMEIQNCNQNSEVEIVKKSTSANASYYTTFATADAFSDPFFLYDNTFYYNDNINLLLCVPNIISFTSPVFPGTWFKGTTSTGYLMTIQGTNFGVAKGFGNVFFINANDPNSTDWSVKYPPLNASDFISWTNTEIKIKMPSLIDSLPNNLKAVPGSGLFYVKTNLGDSVFSSTSVFMPYAVKNVLITSPDYKKHRYDLAGPLDSGAYEFRLDTSISNNPDARAVVDKAIREWSCVTGVRWSIGADITLQAQADDGVSVIYFDDITTTLGLTRLQTDFCVNSFNDTIAFPKEMDIRLARNLGGGFTWFYDTTGADIPPNQHDFFHVIEHELGHAHVLRHVNNTDDLMYYKATSGPLAGANRKEVIGSISAIDGGQSDIMVKSTTLVLTPCTNVNLMFSVSPENCTGGPTAIKEYSKGFEYLNVYPNPVGSSVLNISYELKSNSYVQFRLIDYTGKEAITINSGYQPAGSYQKHINTDQLTSGFYFLIVNIGEELYTKKVIKL